MSMCWCHAAGGQFEGQRHPCCKAEHCGKKGVGVSLGAVRVWNGMLMWNLDAVLMTRLICRAHAALSVRKKHKLCPDSPLTHTLYRIRCVPVNSEANGAGNDSTSELTAFWENKPENQHQRLTTLVLATVRNTSRKHGGACDILVKTNTVDRWLI